MSRLSSVVFTVILSSCECTSPDLVDAPPTEAAVNGQVVQSLCDGLPGALVAVVDQPSSTVTTDDSGAFSLTLPSRAALLVRAPRSVPTMSATRDFKAGDHVDLASVPKDLSDLLHGLAGFSLTEASGTVALLAFDEAPLPIEGVTFSLFETDGGLAAANQRARAFVYGPTTFGLDGGTTSATAGAVVFFGVRPGQYRAQASRAGYTFAELELAVVANTITLDTMQGRGAGGAAPVEFSGVISALGGAPLADASVRLEYDDGTVVSTTTQTDGGYRLQLPKLRKRFDVTASADGYAPLRSPLLCAGQWSSWALRLGDVRNALAVQTYALGATPSAEESGVIVASVAQGVMPVAGAQVWLTPDAGTAFYGEDLLAPGGCERGRCGDGGVCASGERCEDGVCVFGTAPTCVSCDITECPSGFIGTASNGSCRCTPTMSGACNPHAPTCGLDAYCAPLSLDAGTCVLRRPTWASTHAAFGSDVQPAIFGSVAPGVYAAHATTADGGQTSSVRLRVSPHVTTTVRLEAP